MSDFCGSAACGCCRCCTSFIFTSGLTAFFIYLSLRTSNPKCSLEDFYIPSLNKSSLPLPLSLQNHNINLTLKFKNVMKDKGVRYDDLKLNLLYYTQNTSQPIGNTTMKGFKQGHGKKAKKSETVVGYGGFWEEAGKDNKTAVFGVSLSTRVKFKILFWYTKKHHWNFVTNVTVDDTGKRSGGGGLRPRGRSAVEGFLVILCFMTLF